MRFMINDLRFKIGYWAIGLFAYLFIGLFLSRAAGQTMSNKDYTIKMQEFNAVSGAVTNGDQSTLSPFGAQGAAVSENIASSLPFSASLSSDIIDFGSLIPTNPIIRTADLSVYSLSLYGYSVIASEDHPLKMNPDASGVNIPDATCDNGECSQEKAGAWINTLTYGFGYRCDNMTGFDCDSSFSNAEGTPSGPNFYKHFADTSNAQPPQSVMAGIGAKNKDVRLSYRVNISGTQAIGIYNNIITYIAIPNF